VYNSIYFPQAKKCVGFLTFFTTISAGKKLYFAPSEVLGELVKHERGGESIRGVG
jgi:hypothetical protein